MRRLKNIFLPLLFMISGLNFYSNGQVNIAKSDDLTYGFVNTESKGGYAYVRFEAGYSNEPVSYDPTVIYLDPNATCNFDGKYDAYKLLGNNIYMTNFYTFGCDSSMQSINCLPTGGDDPCYVRLGIKTEKDSDITFRIRDIVGDFLYRRLSILDVVTGKNQSLLNSKEYTVNLTTGHYKDRFYIILSDAINTAVLQNQVQESFKIFPSRGSLMVEINSLFPLPGILTIYNLMGQLLLQYEIQDSGYHEFNHSLECGIYVVTFRSGSRMLSKKIFIHDN